MTTSWQLAQLNIARMRYDLDDARMGDFVGARLLSRSVAVSLLRLGRTDRKNPDSPRIRRTTRPLQ